MEAMIENLEFSSLPVNWKEEAKKINGPLADFYKKFEPGVWIHDDCPLQSFIIVIDLEKEVYLLRK